MRAAACAWRPSCLRRCCAVCHPRVSRYVPQMNVNVLAASPRHSSSGSLPQCWPIGWYLMVCTAEEIGEERRGVHAPGTDAWRPRAAPASAQQKAGLGRGPRGDDAAPYNYNPCDRKAARRGVLGSSRRGERLVVVVAVVRRLVVSVLVGIVVVVVVVVVTLLLKHAILKGGDVEHVLLVKGDINGEVGSSEVGHDGEHDCGERTSGGRRTCACGG
eukprot:CAMPEP_0206035328 /NCGR_PEP_ID=MMETSP1466-20131121/1993_1 /ASSEMBLY_ACC=CAM_ASM_001126 /TAXON_ID=44452 /ORGANISM="Pavlova gyrans, Strain CCMP608" /LENGTH=215 /DNA_ID=CAMNT_0053409695 /DNA_START=229 /DNA_END=873 /DNA_ORIENTATION=+